MNIYSIHFSLKSFEGPLDILLSLIQKNEIDIHEISLFELVNQCLQELYKQQKEKLNLGAEFVGTVAYFLFLKSTIHFIMYWLLKHYCYYYHYYYYCYYYHCHQHHYSK